MAMATTSAELRRSAASSCGARAIPVTGKRINRSRPPRLKALKLLMVRQPSSISHLVTYREHCRVRYKITAWRKTQRLWGLSPWSRAVRYKRTSPPPPANCYFGGGIFWAASARKQRKQLSSLYHDYQTRFAASTAAPNSRQFQLGGSSLGPPRLPSPCRPRCLGAVSVLGHRR